MSKAEGRVYILVTFILLGRDAISRKHLIRGLLTLSESEFIPVRAGTGQQAVSSAWCWSSS